MQLSKNQLLTIRSKYYERYGDEKHFPANEENPRYEELASELLVFTQRVKSDCFVNCKKTCLAARDCKIEKSKTTRFALSASKKQLSQLLHQPSPNVKTQHDSFYEGFVELCCRFIGIDWEDFNKTAQLEVLHPNENPIQNESDEETMPQIRRDVNEVNTPNSSQKKTTKEKLTNKIKLHRNTFLTILFTVSLFIVFFIQKNNVNSEFIEVFEKFHNATSSKDWKTTWELTDSTWRHSDTREIYSEEDFYKYYRMTTFYHFIKYEKHETMPNSFYATYEFIDDAPKLNYLKNLRDFSSDIYKVIGDAYFTPDNFSKDKIDSLLINHYNVESLNEHNLPDRIAIHLKLSPKRGRNLFQDPNPRKFRVKMQVTMNYYNEGWKIHQTFRKERKEVNLK